MRLASLSSVFAVIFTLFNTSSFTLSITVFVWMPVQSPGIYRFRFIWVHGLYSFLQHLKAFSSHHLAMFKCDFRTLRHSIAVSWLSWLACKMISLAFFNALWLSWYIFRSSTNRPCVLFTIRLPGSLILYPWLCWSSIHTGIR